MKEMLDLNLYLSIFQSIYYPTDLLFYLSFELYSYLFDYISICSYVHKVSNHSISYLIESADHCLLNGLRIVVVVKGGAAPGH